MTKHFFREIQGLKEAILGLSSRVEESVSLAVKAVHERDMDSVERVLKGDREIDALEVEVEEECLKILALHQPVAHDLRFIVAVLKINNDLERIGDLACNIAWRAKVLSQVGPVDLQFNVLDMSAKVRRMLSLSLHALIEQDTEIARRVCTLDDEVDSMHDATFRMAQDEIAKTPSKTEALFSVVHISRNLERIADHATNIAEDVIYMVDGEIVRHGFTGGKS